MKRIYRKLLFSPGSKYSLNDLDQSDIKFLLELMQDESESQIIKYADGFDWL